MQGTDIVISTLTKLGFSENDAILYEILLKNPDASISTLQKKSPFSRTMLYYILDSLDAWGVIEIKKDGNKTVYIAKHPDKIHEIMGEQEKEVKQQKKLINDIMPDLSSLYRLGHKKPGIRYFEGKEGLKQAMFESLNASETIYTISDFEAIARHVPEINKEYSKHRDAKQIKKKILLIDNPFTREFVKKQSKEFVTPAFLPKEMNPFSTGLEIYDNKVVFFTVREDNILAVIIEDPDIYAMHKSIFEYLWNESEKQTSVEKEEIAEACVFD